MPEARKSITVEVPLDFFHGIVTDFERYGEFLPEIKQVKVRSVEGNAKTIDFTVDYIKTIRYSLRMVNESKQRVSWTFIEGEMMKDNSGYWDLQPEGDGRTRATYIVSITFKGFIPSAITNKMVEVGLPSMLENFKKRAENLYKKSRPA